MADAFPGFEAVVAVQLNREALEDLIKRDAVHGHQFDKLFSLVKDDLRIDLHPQLKVFVLLLCYRHGLRIAVGIRVKLIKSL